MASDLPSRPDPKTTGGPQVHHCTGLSFCIAVLWAIVFVFSLHVLYVTLPTCRVGVWVAYGQGKKKTPPGGKNTRKDCSVEIFVISRVIKGPRCSTDSSSTIVGKWSVSTPEVRSPKERKGRAISHRSLDPDTCVILARIHNRAHRSGSARWTRRPSGAWLNAGRPASSSPRMRRSEPLSHHLPLFPNPRGMPNSAPPDCETIETNFYRDGSLLGALDATPATRCQRAGSGGPLFRACFVGPTS